AEPGPATLGERLCALVVRVVEVSGASVMVADGERSTVCASDALAARLAELQLSLGEGPGLDAHESGGTVAETDLALADRWPAFAPAALDAGARAAFALPLRVGAARLGALTLHRERPGALTASQHADSLTMAALVCHAVLARQAQAPAGALASELEHASA